MIFQKIYLYCIVFVFLGACQQDSKPLQSQPKIVSSQAVNDTVSQKTNITRYSQEKVDESFFKFKEELEKLNPYALTDDKKQLLKSLKSLSLEELKEKLNDGTLDKMLKHFVVQRIAQLESDQNTGEENEANEEDEEEEMISTENGPIPAALVVASVAAIVIGAVANGHAYLGFLEYGITGKRLFRGTLGLGAASAGLLLLTSDGEIPPETIGLVLAGLLGLLGLEAMISSYHFSKPLYKKIGVQDFDDLLEKAVFERLQADYKKKPPQKPKTEADIRNEAKAKIAKAKKNPMTVEKFKSRYSSKSDADFDIKEVNKKKLDRAIEFQLGAGKTKAIKKVNFGRQALKASVAVGFLPIVFAVVAVAGGIPLAGASTDIFEDLKLLGSVQTFCEDLQKSREISLDE